MILCYQTLMKKIFFLLLFFIVISYGALNYIKDKDISNYLKNHLNQNQKYLLKKYLFPFQVISQHEKNLISERTKIQQLEQLFFEIASKSDFSEEEYHFKVSLNDIKLDEKIVLELENNLKLTKFKIKNGFYSGIKNIYPGSGYIDFHFDNMLLLSSKGILSYSDNELSKQSFKQIKNNIDDFINLEQFSTKRTPQANKFSIKDLLIKDNKIYISYTEEIEKDCWNTSIIYSDMNYDNIVFENFFRSKCIHSINNLDNEFEPHQSGGRMFSFDDNHILFGTGEYRSRYLAQDKKSINGKVLKINIYDKDYEIISMGHRNPQGLYFDKKNNFIIETEHGPKGGDEINIIYLNGNRKIPNYGWPISSAGIHYVETNEKKQKYPLYKSHDEHGFIEPIKAFVPSIAISEVTKLNNETYVVSSLKNKSLYFFNLNKDKKIINLKRVEVFERVRDLFFKNGKLYMFLETTPSIGIISNF